MPARKPGPFPSHGKYRSPEGHLEPYEMTVIRSPHRKYIPWLAGVFNTENYALCEQVIKRHMVDRRKPDRKLLEWECHITSAYYNGMYLILLAACRDDTDYGGLLLSFQALSVLKRAVYMEARSPKSQELLETLVFIAVRLCLKFGGPLRKLDTSSELLNEETKELLKDMSIKELGSEALMVHYALSEELRRVAKQEDRIKRDSAIGIDDTRVETPESVPGTPEDVPMTDIPYEGPASPRKRQFSDACRYQSESPPKRQRSGSPTKFLADRCHSTDGRAIFENEDLEHLEDSKDLLLMRAMERFDLEPQKEQDKVS